MLFACYEKGPFFALCMHKDTCRDRWPTPELGTCKLLTKSTGKANGGGAQTEAEGGGWLGTLFVITFLLAGAGALSYGAWKFFGASSMEDVDDDLEDDFDDDEEEESQSQKKEKKKKKKEKKEKKKKTKEKGEDFEMMRVGDDEDEDEKDAKESKKNKKDKKKNLTSI